MKNLIKILILLVIIGITTIVYIITKLNIKLDDKDSIGYSERAMEITVSSIGVSLEENGEIVSYRNYIDSDWSDYGERILFSKDIERFIPGKIYPENITVRNTGGIDIYARIIVTRSFVEDQIGLLMRELPQKLELYTITHCQSKWEKEHLLLLIIYRYHQK